MKCVRIAIMFVMVLAPLAGHTEGAYLPGFTWHRSADWLPGTVPGATDGNASNDKNGNPAWFYGVLSGGGKSSPDPWFENTATPMVWNNAWYGGGVGGVWSRTYDLSNGTNVGENPPIDRYAMFHDLSQVTKSSQYMPTVDWLNPVGHGAVLNLSGSFTFSWEGPFASNSPLAPIEAVITKYDSSGGHFETQWSAYLTNPDAGLALSSNSKLTVPVTLVGLRFDEGDFLRFTFRGTSGESAIPLWQGSNDAVLMRLVTVVPEPGLYMMYLLGSILLFGIFGRKRLGN